MMRARLGAAALALLALSSAVEGRAQELRTFSSSRRVGAEEALDVRVTYGAGRLTVAPASEGVLYRMKLRYDEELFEPVAELDGRRLRLGVEGRGRNVRIGDHEGGELQVQLTREIPMRLALNFGAGRAHVDLGGLSLTGLDIETGATEARIDVSQPNPTAMESAQIQVGAADFSARRLGNLNARRIELHAGVGDVTIDLTGDWRQNTDVSVQMGLGALELVIPEGLGVRLHERTFLTSVDTQGLVKRGDAYYSLDWEKAERRITVDIRAAFGSVDIRWVR